MRPAGLLGLLAVLVASTSGCGSSGASASTTAPPATLPPHVVPYLPSTIHTLTRAGLAREAGAPTLRGQLRSWGFQTGADRYFQGESRQLQVVDSRALRFNSPSGASQFVDFVRLHAAVYLGSYPRMRAFSSRGRTGILATAQPCTCHLANPAFLAVVTRGGVVTWLEINGPGATAHRLATLIAMAP
jgi:hypothetical protein